MGIFSTTLGNLSEAMQRESDTAAAAPPKKPKESAVDWRRRTAQLRTENRQREYAAVFSEPKTAVAGAAELSVGHTACCIQLRRYEARGLVELVGDQLAGNSKSNLWRWKS